MGKYPIASNPYLELWSLHCDPWARHIYPSLVLVQPRKTKPCLTERLLIGCKESNQTNKIGPVLQAIKKSVKLWLFLIRQFKHVFWVLKRTRLIETVLLSTHSICLVWEIRIIIFSYTLSTLDKQRICVNTQLKSSKKQLNVWVPKSNSNDQYAITCDVIGYHSVHFVSIRLINKCQSGIDFIFTSVRAIYSSFMKISVPSPVLRGKTLRWKWNFEKFTRSNVNKGMRFASGTIKSASLIL